MIARTGFSGCEVTAAIEPTPAISWGAVALAVMLNVAPADLAEALTTEMDAA